MAGGSFKKLRNPASDTASAGPRGPGKSEINPEYQPGLVALEIDEIQGCRRSGRPAPCLNAPGDRKPGALRQLQVGGPPGEQRLPGKLFQTHTAVFPEEAPYAADDTTWPDLR